ncbi:MAG: hypothetical protein KBT03_04300 [Bacteroidales bacterium]|nr:hypothetical protein [Candidatus Scybalousia scybalohippi]
MEEITELTTTVETLTNTTISFLSDTQAVSEPSSWWIYVILGVLAIVLFIFGDALEPYLGPVAKGFGKAFSLFSIFFFFNNRR